MNKWRKTHTGYELWLGNGMYAVVDSLMRVDYSKWRRRRNGKLSKEVRFWAGGVVARGIGGEVQVRGLVWGAECRTLKAAKFVALEEASCVCRAMIGILEEQKNEVCKNS